MTTKRLAALSLGLLLAVPAFATPKELGHDIWQETYNGNHHYRVDAVAQLCFAITGGGGMTTIDCAQLKRRAEWKNIITWINDAPAPAK